MTGKEPEMSGHRDERQGELAAELSRLWPSTAAVAGTCAPASLETVADSPGREAPCTPNPEPGLAHQYQTLPQMEQELREQNRRLKIVYRMTATASRAETLAEIYEVALEALADILSADRLAVLVNDANRVMRFQAWRNLSEGYRQAVDGHSPWASDDPDPRPVLIPSIVDDPAALGMLYDVIHAEGIRAIGFFPLVYRAQLRGKFMTYYDQPHNFTADEVELVENFASHIASAIGRKQADVDLRESENKLRQIIDLIPYLISARDRAGRFLMVNRALAASLDLTVDEMLGRSEADFGRPPEVWAEFGELDRVVLDEGEPVFVPELRCLDSTGRVHYLQVNKLPFSMVGRREPLVLTAILDVTERKLAQEQLHKMQKMESLAVLSGGVAHDFNNLLVSLMGQASLAMAKLPPQHAATGHLQKVLSASERAAVLTRHLLDYSGRGQFSLQAIDLSAFLAEQVYEMLLPDAPHVRLTLDLAPQLPLVRADGGQLAQLLRSLLHNAVEALGSRPGEVVVRTTVQTLTAKDEGFWRHTGQPLAAGQYVLLEVRDTGCGMDPTTVDQIFEPFYTTKFTGRGLGLAAVLGIVRGHQGGIQVESCLNGGSAFRVALPISHEQPARSVGQRASATQSPPVPVLVIDDDAFVSEAIVDILSIANIEAIVAHNGLAALRQLAKCAQTLRLVLLDMSVHMPDGSSLLSCIRQAYPALPVVIISGRSFQQAQQQHAGLSPAMFIQKPFEAVHLIKLVQAQLAAPVGRPA